jgi:CBS domain containing-hemolysin-like protein
VSTILAVAGLTLLASFLCSLFEAALYSITPSQVELIKQRGVRGAGKLQQLRRNVEQPIAAILTVNTIAHTLGAAWCGAMVAAEFGDAMLGVFTAVFTVLVLALTEVVPKSLGVRHAGALGPLVAWPIQWMVWSVWPVVWLAERAMRGLTGGHAAPPPNEEEVLLFARMAADGGSVRGEERRWVENALRLDRVSAGELRTPRTVVECLAADMRLGDLDEQGLLLKHSRLPLVGNVSDEVLGLVHRRDIYDALAADQHDLKLRDLMRPIEFVPESMAAHDLLDLFLERRRHLVAVADEFGGFEGVVTLEDVLECFLGREIVDETDDVVDLQALARKRAAESGLIAPERENGDEEGR